MDIDGFRVKGLRKSRCHEDICWAALTRCRRHGAGPGGGELLHPPTYLSFGAYICVMNIDVDTGVYKVRRFYALDDCGTRINPMIIEGRCMAD